MIALVLLATLQAPPPGSAPVVRWRAPAPCPDSPEIHRRIEAHLARGLDEPRPVPVEVEASVEATQALDGAPWRLRLAVTTPTGRSERVLEGHDCEKLTEVAALLAAVAIDPQDSREAPQPALDAPSAPETAAPSPAPATAPPPPAAAPERPPGTAPPQQPRVTGAIGLLGGLDVRTLGRPTGFLEAHGALRWRWLRFELGVAHRFRRALDLPAEGPGSARVWTTAGVLRGCGVPTARWLEVPLCVGVELGALSGRSRGIARPAAAHLPWAAGRLGAGLTVVRWRPIGIVLRAELLIPMTRARIEVQGRGLLHRIDPVAGMFSAGFEVRLPPALPLRTASEVRGAGSPRRREDHTRLRVRAGDPRWQPTSWRGQSRDSRGR